MKKLSKSEHELLFDSLKNHLFISNYGLDITDSSEILQILSVDSDKINVKKFLVSSKSFVLCSLTADELIAFLKQSKILSNIPINTYLTEKKLYVASTIKYALKFECVNRKLVKQILGNEPYGFYVHAFYDSMLRDDNAFQDPSGLNLGYLGYSMSIKNLILPTRTSFNLRMFMESYPNSAKKRTLDKDENGCDVFSVDYELLTKRETVSEVVETRIDRGWLGRKIHKTAFYIKTNLITEEKDVFIPLSKLLKEVSEEDGKKQTYYFRYDANKHLGVGRGGKGPCILFVSTKKVICDLIKNVTGGKLHFMDFVNYILSGDDYEQSRNVVIGPNIKMRFIDLKTEKESNEITYLRYLKNELNEDLKVRF